MELKVWVEGIQRIVCGVTEKTSCQDVVYALAYATGKTGRFTLIERWRNNERLLAPHEHPLKVLMKWGEYSNDVQFILQRTSPETSKSPSKLGKHIDSNHGFSPTGDGPGHRDGRKCATPDFTLRDGVKRKDNVGIVKGIPQRPLDTVISSDSEGGKSPKDPGNYPADPFIAIHNAQNSGNVDTSHFPNGFSGCTSEISVLKTAPLHRGIQRTRGDGKDKASLPLPPYRDPPNANSVISKAKELPPYRDPPPPPLAHHGRTFSYLQSVHASPPSTSNPQHAMPPVHDALNNVHRRYDSAMLDLKNNLDNNVNRSREDQLNELMRIVNQQQDKLSSQVSEISKYNSEIKFWETRSQQSQDESDLITETNRLDKLGRHAEEELRYLQTVEDEHDLTKQKEKTLQSEIALLKTKLVNCETQILQCKNKIRVLADEFQEESKLLRMNEVELQEKEAAMLKEVNNLKLKLEAAMVEYDRLQVFGDLEDKTNGIDLTIANKKKEVEKLVKEMKKVNLESLSISPPDELKKQSIEGLKQLHPRKIIGSPRQLETAVPTAKNPHGVWV